MPILLEDITFSGLMRVKMKLMSNFPHIQIVDLCFMEKPVIDYVLKPIGGETFGFDIANIPGLSSFIREMTHATLAPMMYDPTFSPSILNNCSPALLLTRQLASYKLPSNLPGESKEPRSVEEHLILMSPFQSTTGPSWLSRSTSTIPVGIVRLTIHQAKELDSTKTLSDDVNPLAKVFLASNTRKPIFSTKTFKHTKSPVWEAAHEFLCADKKSSVITIQVIDDRDFLKDPCIGYMSIRLEDLLAFNPRNVGQGGDGVEPRDWFPLSDCKHGKIRVSAEWKPLNMAGSLHGASAYTPPIGVVRLWLDRATDVKNVEAALGGKSDPYVRVQVNNVTKARTEVINNNLNPVWDQIVYIPIHSLKESLLLECMDYQHLTRDRSLGTVELHLSDIAEENPDDASYPYKSRGIKEAQDPIRLDKGNVFKGQLHYKAEFVPALNLRGVKFEESGNDFGQAQTTTQSGSDDDAGSVVSMASGVSSDREAATAVTIKRHTKGRKSIDSTTGANGTGSVPPSPTSPTSPVHADSPAEEKKEEGSGVEMTTEELLGQQSGIIVFNVVSGLLAKKGRLEVLLDDGYWPAFTTQRASSRKASWSYVGEGFIKELDFGKVWLRLNEADEGEKDNIVAEWRGDAKAFLQATLEGPRTYELQDGDEKNTSTVTIETRYVPVPVKLEPRESVNNQGLLHVTLLDGRDLRAADRNGKSDPYVVFVLNDDKVFKSQTIKKTLNPDWHEDFDISVRSRVGSKLNAEVCDWDTVGRPDPLGDAQIDLENLEPFEAVERTLPLVLEKEGAKGRIRVRLLFKPEIIVKTRSKTSTFSTAGRAMTQIGGLPVQAGKGVFHGVTGVFKRDKDDGHAPPVPQVASGQASQPVGASGVPAPGGAFNAHERLSSGASASSEPGTLRVVVIDAKDLSTGDAKPYATIRVGDKEVKTKHAGKTAQPEWNETHTFSASALTPKLYVWVHDHKTLGKDKLLGDGEVDIWRHISPETISAAEITVELHNGSGLVRMRVEFDPTTKRARRSSISSNNDRNGGSMISPSRFSLRGRRPGTGGDSDD
ncbi:Tricalbin-2 [Marasmius tenuissimus]|nr:Tricalbin-2 [Marasmius tenuissimus]